MQLYETVSEFFGFDVIDEITTFGDFVPWFVKVAVSIIIFGVCVRMFMSLLISFTRGIK